MTKPELEAELAAVRRELGLGSREEVIEALRVSPRHFDRHVLPHLVRTTVGRRVFFRWEEVDRWLRTQEVGPSNETVAPESTSSGFGTRSSDTTGPRAKRFLEKLKKRQLGSTKKSPRDGEQR